MKYEKITNFNPPKKTLRLQNFKIGDKVKIIGGSFVGNMSVGNKAIVINILNSRIRCNSINGHYPIGLTFHPSQLQKLE